MDNIITTKDLTFDKANQYLCGDNDATEVVFSKDVKVRVENSHNNFLAWFKKDIPIYGVTTGFGESCYRTIDPKLSSELQNNLVSYLMVGTGKLLPRDVGRSILFFRIISLSRGFSGISMELLNKMKELFNKGIYPVIPREGSLGASGDLIPLAYLANNIRGEGEAYYQGKICNLEDLSSKGIYEPYSFKPKEGLALVNGATSMVGLSFHNYKKAQFLTELAALCTSWLCLTVNGRSEAFGKLVNTQSKKFLGQGKVANNISILLEQEFYKSVTYENIVSKDGKTSGFIQDPYSLRCAPQVIGPIVETLDNIKNWIEIEMNGVSDNPLFDQENNFANGGNFYGGYLAHSMDYLKICMGNLADLMDRQLTMLISDKTNRGLTANLVNLEGVPPERHHLYHGLKGVHQSVSAITSEIMAKCMPNSIFSRSSESHNQDKVSLGMSAATQCSDQLDSMFTIFSCYLTCLAQAIDLRKIKLKGDASLYCYQLIREHVDFINKDVRLDHSINKLRASLIERSQKERTFYV
jgi:histidine ammonia-lyase